MRIGSASLVLLCGLTTPAFAGDQPLVEAGRALFTAQCTICHGPAVDAGEAGDITGVSRSVVARATRGIEQMPAFDLSAAEIDALVAYLAFMWEHSL